MRCVVCGHENAIEGASFCTACGKPLTSVSPAAAQGPEPVSSKTPPPVTISNLTEAREERTKDTAAASSGSSSDDVSGQPQWAAILVAALLYVAVADAAVETFISGSPVRWWVASVGAAYLVLNLLVSLRAKSLWNRFSWRAKSAASFLVLLGLMALTAWLPGGLSDGIRILHQPTPVVFAAVSGAAVAYTGYLLATPSMMPVAGRIAAVVAAAYGVAAFGLAIRSGTAYPDLFHGDSLWTRLPFWMQGAVAGSFLTIPSALVAELGTRLLRVSSTKLSRWGFKLVALTMSLIMVVAGLRLPYGSDTSSASVVEHDTASRTPPPTPIRTDEKGYTSTVRQVDRMMAALNVVDKKVDRSLFEIDALAARLGSDPVAIFHFVRDQISYEPYYGVLRGARGALICRAANSLDRSLLLAALLQKSGFKVQIATGQLDDAHAMTLINRLFEPARPVPTALPPFADLAPDIGHALGATVEELTRYSNELEKRAKVNDQSLWSTVDSEASALSKALNESGVDVSAVKSLDRLTAEAREHYWVRYQNAAGQWVDLDSAFAANEPGSAMTAVSESFAPDAIPEDRYHRIGIKLFLRTSQEGGKPEDPGSDIALIDQDFHVADRQGVEITLANVPIPAPKLMTPGVQLASALAPVSEYVSMLKVGDQLVLSKYFNLKGGMYEDPPGSELGNAERTNKSLSKPLGGAASALDQLSGQISGESATEPAGSTRIVGQWVNYRLTSPGPRGQPATTREYRREIIAPETVTAWSADGPKGGGRSLHG